MSAVGDACMTYAELVAIGYTFTKPHKLYHVTAPDGKPLGITSESKEALAWAARDCKNVKK